MRYRIEISAAARKQLERLPEFVRRQIDGKILALADNPRPPGVVYLKGQLKGLLRIRSGNYRILYRVEDDRLLVIIVQIGDRKDVYE